MGLSSAREIASDTIEKILTYYTRFTLLQTARN